MVGAHLRRSLAPRLVLSDLQHPANAVGRKQLPLLPGGCCSTLLGWTQSGGTIRPSARFLPLLLGRERVPVEVEASQCLTCAAFFDLREPAQQMTCPHPWLPRPFRPTMRPADAGLGDS